MHTKCCRLSLADYFEAVEGESFSTTSVAGNLLTLEDSAGQHQVVDYEDVNIASDVHVMRRNQSFRANANQVFEEFANRSGSSGDNTIEVDTKCSSVKEVSLDEYSTHPHNPSADNSMAMKNGSVINIEGRFEFRSKLRLRQCSKHKTTVLMAAVRHNDKDLLLNIIKHMAETSDFELENLLGDTALSLACRYKRSEMVQLLIEYGANVNHETFNGRTPLIEAIQADASQIVDELIKYGASVSQKTRKLRIHALTWARRYRNEDIIRLVELGYSVEKRMEGLLLDISCGRIDRIRAAVKGGKPFQAGILPRYHDELHLSIEHLNHAKKLVREWQDKVSAAQEQALASSLESDKSKQKINEIDRMLKEVQAQNEEIYDRVGRHFEAFKSKALSLKEADVSEVIGSSASLESTRISLLAYGLIFGVLDINQTYSFGAEEYSLWLNSVTNTMQNPSSTLLRLQLFNFKIFMKSNTGSYLQFFHSLYLSMESALTQEHILQRAKDKKFESQKCESRKRKKEPFLIRKLLSFGIRNVVYDSDEDVSSSGKWVKGRWISGKHLRSKETHKNDVHGNQEDAIVSQYDAKIAEVPLFFFVEVMFSLLRSVHELYLMSDDISTCTQRLNDLHKRLTRLQDDDIEVQRNHTIVIEYRDQKEKELVIRLKHLKAMGEDVENNLARLKVYRMLSLVSPSGYTAVAWAGKALSISFLNFVYFFVQPHMDFTTPLMSWFQTEPLSDLPMI